ncbi:hypothetical protein DFH28DRAFT_914098 [Melampsora americana]|nr:hypothetical protein DFH28DRAFT_914098 [Melampsora americana]
MAACICDDVLLWGRQNKSEITRDCWICKYLKDLPYADRSDCTSNSSGGSGSLFRILLFSNSHYAFVVFPPRRKDNSNSPASIRARQRLEIHRRESDKVKAQRDIKVYIQKKRRDEFASLREALYLVYTYQGPFLQNPGEKKKAAQYLRRMGFGAMFVRVTDHEVKWKWLEARVKESSDMTPSLSTPF